MMKMVARQVMLVIAQAFILSIAVGSPTMQDIYVSKRGSFDASCGSDVSPCKDLDVAIEKASNNSRVVVREGPYFLQRKHTFTSVNNLTIIGENLVDITCSANVNIAFLFSSNIGLYNLKFHECSGWQKSFIGQDKSTGKMQVMNYLTAFYFSYCKHVQIQNVEVSGSIGVGLTLTDVSGTVKIADSLFKNNMPEQNTTAESGSKDDKSHAGGGMFFMLNSYGYNPLNISRENHEKYQHNGRFIMENVQFIGNEARSPDINYGISSPLTPFSRGGGLGIYLFGNANSNTFTLSRCSFIGNRAQWGAGFQAEFKHETENNIIEVKECVIKENYAHFAGGGARIGDITISNKTLVLNRFTFRDCQFHNNTSVWGGGLSVYGTTFVETFPPIPGAREKFQITNTSFSENKGNVGSAIGLFLFNLNDDNIGPLVPVHVVLADCTITHNLVVTIKHDVLIGQGAVYTVEIPVISRGYLHIANNTRSSMVLDSAILEVHGKAVFLYNEGYRGGALALYGNSRVRLARKSKLYFIGNQCVEKGGAIYVDAPGSPQVSFNATGYATHQCFFDYIGELGIDFDLWETEIVFQGNEGPNNESGLSVYATTLQNCRRLGETRKKNTVLKWKFVKFLESNGVNISNVDREVSTDPVDMVYHKDEWSVAPSETFNASITLLDEIGNPVYGIINIEIVKNDNSRVQLDTTSPLFLVHEKQVKFLKLVGQNGKNFDVIIRSVGRYILQKTIKDVTLRKCNPGFHSENDKCVCSDSKLPGVSRCSGNGYKVFLKGGYWAGTVGDEFYTVPCPVNYCQCPNPYGENAIGECTYAQNKMCAGHRDQNSILCGSCKHGYTASFGSESCIPNCTKGRIAYFLLIGLILTILVMGLMMIDVDVFTGYLNAWLYSYQVIALLTPGSFEFDDFMEFLIGLANLQLRVDDKGSCFSEGLDEADKLVIMYVLPGFLILLVYIIAKVVKRFPNWCYSRKVRSPFSAFSTIFVLCYTNITGISLKILNPSMYEIDGKHRLLAQGELEMFHGKHLAYGLLACACLVFIVVPIPALLILQPWVAKCLRRFKVNLQSLKPLFDKLQGCFKGKSF